MFSTIKTPITAAEALVIRQETEDALHEAICRTLANYDYSGRNLEPSDRPMTYVLTPDGFLLTDTFGHAVLLPYQGATLANVLGYLRELEGGRVAHLSEEAYSMTPTQRAAIVERINQPDVIRPKRTNVMLMLDKMSAQHADDILASFPPLPHENHPR